MNTNAPIGLFKVTRQTEPMNTETRYEFNARLGGAWNPQATDAYPHTGYVFIDLPDGHSLQLVYNAETRLFTADVIHRNGKRGHEFVRCTVPQP